MRIIEKENNQKYIKAIYILIAIIFTIPSITYAISGKGIINIFSDFSFFYTKVGSQITTTKIIGTVLFASIFIALFTIYIYIIKNANKLFATNREMAKYIIIICAIFTIILPMTSTDIYYYIGTGWCEAKYKVNPYYTSIKDVMENEVSNGRPVDEILQKTPQVWREQTIVYGPLWPIMCKILSGLSFGNVGIALAIYKIFNLILHILNCYIIYKLTNKKKAFVLLYALNPMILFNVLSNVHNDILAISLILVALYFLKKKHNIALTVVFTALATAVKYYAILLIPFLIIYYYRKQKPLKRILYAGRMGSIVYSNNCSNLCNIHERL